MGVTVVRTALTASTAVTRARASVVIVAPIAETSAALLAAATSVVVAGASVTVIVPAANLNYILLASAAYLDTSGRFQFFPEEIFVADASFRSTQKALTDTFAPTDYIASIDTQLAYTDSVALPDFVIRTLEYIRRFTDTIDFAHQVSFTFSRPLADNFALSDSAAKGFTKPLSSSFSLSDTAPTFLYQLAYTHSVSLQETFRTVFSKALVDSAGTADATQFNLGKHSADVFYVPDSISRDTSKALFDSFTHTDLVAKDAGKSLVDSFPLSDFAFRDTFKVFSDDFSHSDSLSRVVDKGVFDSLVLSDFSSRIIGRVINDGVAMNDSADLADNITYQAVKYINNLVFVADTSTRAWDTNKADSVSLVSSGILSSQNYCDLSYFAEDYVGISRTFS
jgi:hypothetical protein